jgi:hypothetical protein
MPSASPRGARPAGLGPSRGDHEALERRAGRLRVGLPAPRSVRKLGRARTWYRAGMWQATIGHERRPLPLAASARDPRWMVNRRQQLVIEYLVEETRPQGPVEGAAPPVDRRPAPTPRGQGPATRSPGPEAGSNHRDARLDPAVAPAADRPEVDVRAEAARAARVHAGDRLPHSEDGQRVWS